MALQSGPQIQQENKDQNKRPSVFDYVNYRDFLKNSLDHLQRVNPYFSASAFVQKAGFGANSRGYFNLILKGKRNLSTKTILGFSMALKLNEKEANFFEALVHYNQAKKEEEKKIYFEKLSKAVKGRKNKAFELLKSQYNYFSRWYLVAIREMVSLIDFQEDPSWISRKLRGKVKKSEITSAISDLLQLGLLKRNEMGLLEQSEDLVQFSDSTMNYTVVNQLHREILDRAKESLEEDQYDERSASCVILTTKKENFEEIRDEIRQFRESILSKYGSEVSEADCVLNLGLQLFHITSIDKKEERKL